MMGDSGDKKQDGTEALPCLHCLLRDSLKAYFKVHAAELGASAEEIEQAEKNGQTLWEANIALNALAILAGEVLGGVKPGKLAATFKEFLELVAETANSEAGGKRLDLSFESRVATRTRLH